MALVTGKRRREEGGFLGADKIIPQIGKAVPRRRVGLIVEGAPAREGAEIFNAEGESIGWWLNWIWEYLRFANRSIKKAK